MFSLTTIVLGALVASTTSAVPFAPSTRSTSRAFKLVADYSGNSFFDNFVPYTGADTTEGHVNYTDMAFAAQNGYVGFILNQTSDKTSAYIGVDHKNQAPNGRNSVRLTSKDSWNVGSMVVIDINHIPVQYGLWPAIWLLGSGKDWPAAGESDILEYVHEGTYNAMTLHTSPGCTVDNSSSLFQGRLLHTDCNTDDASTGCSVAAYDQDIVSKQTFATAGTAFNKQGGGVYVHLWTEEGITVWMFPHGRLPSDFSNPSAWKRKPLAKFSGFGCDFRKSFQDMQLILNIDFCGSWAGQADVWSASGNSKYASCNDYVSKNPGAFKESYFDIQSIKFYTTNGQKPGKGPTTFGKRDEAAASAPTRPLFNGTVNSTLPCSNHTATLNSTLSLNGTNSSLPCTKSTNGNLTRRSLPPHQPTISAASSTEIGTWFFVAGNRTLSAARSIGNRMGWILQLGA